MNRNDPKGNLIQGAFWTVGTRWIIKALGFINTIVMARLLMPEDFGIVAIGTLIVGMIQTFLDFGANLALLRKEFVTKNEINSAWSLRLIQGVLAGLMILIVTPFAVNYYQASQLLPIMVTLSMCIFMASAGNIGLTLAQKEFDFLLAFKVETTAKLASVIMTLIGGFIFGDYRALIMGITAGYVTPLLTSYLWHPYRPRWDTSELSGIWKFSKWLLLANMGNFILRKGDELIASRIASTHDYGLYHVGADLGQMPVQEVGPALVRALLPVLSTIQDDIKRTNLAIIKTTSALNTLIWPIGIGFAAISSQATDIILGSKWFDVVPFVIIYSLISILQTATYPAKVLLTLRGHTRIQSHLTWSEFISFAVIGLVLVPRYYLIGLAVSRLIASSINLFATFWATKIYCDLQFTKIFLQVVRPLVGSILMWLMVTKAMLFSDSSIGQIVLGVNVGVITYGFWCLITWYVQGSPEGLESTVLEKIISKFHSKNNG